MHTHTNTFKVMVAEFGGNGGGFGGHFYTCKNGHIYTIGECGGYTLALCLHWPVVYIFVAPSSSHRVSPQGHARVQVPGLRGAGRRAPTPFGRWGRTRGQHQPIMSHLCPDEIHCNDDEIQLLPCVGH